MRWLSDLPLRVKVYAAVLAAVLAAVVVGVVGLQKLSATADAAEYLYSQNLVPISQLGTVQQGVQRSWVAVLDAQGSRTASAMAAQKAAMAKADAQADQTFAEYAASDMTGREDLAERYRTSLAQLRKVRDEKLLPMALAGDMAGFGQARDSTAAPALQATEEALDGLVAIEKEIADQKRAETTDAYHAARNQMIIVLVLGVLLSFAIAYLVVRGIMRTLTAVGRVSGALAEGDLTVRAAVTGRDELGRMATELDTGITTVRHSMDRMSQVAVTLSAASEELSAVSTQLLAGAAEAAQRAAAATAATDETNLGVQTIAAQRGGDDRVDRRDRLQRRAGRAGVAARHVGRGAHDRGGRGAGHRERGDR
nr:hypothetical protein GCM10020092_057010 [Actinoplanes digitatis]